MIQYIDKDETLKELTSLKGKVNDGSSYANGWTHALRMMEIFINNNSKILPNTTWHLQEKDNIYDAVNDWGEYNFICLMNDGTIQRFSGTLAECYDGSINVHIDSLNDEYDNAIDNIIFWIELPKDSNIQWNI